MDENVLIRNSAKALIIEKDCLLAIEMQDEIGIFFILPVGGQDLGESLPDTVRRECREELGIEVPVHELCFVREHIHPEEHRVEFMFRCSLNPRARDLMPTRPDLGQQGPVWIPLSDLPNRRFYPLGLRSLLGQARSHCNAMYMGNIE